MVVSIFAKFNKLFRCHFSLPGFKSFSYTNRGLSPQGGTSALASPIERRSRPDYTDWIPEESAHESSHLQAEQLKTSHMCLTRWKVPEGIHPYCAFIADFIAEMVAE